MSGCGRDINLLGGASESKLVPTPDGEQRNVAHEYMTQVHVLIDTISVLDTSKNNGWIIKNAWVSK